MATYSRIPLSGSTDFRGIKVVQTATAGTTIHTAQASASLADHVHLFANHSYSAAILLTLEWGGVTVPDDNITVTLEADAGLIRLTPPEGLSIRNSLVVKAFADQANQVAIFGHVIRES